MKDFSDLARLRDALRERAQAERDEQELRRRENERRLRESRAFRDAMSDAVPLKPNGRVALRPPSPSPRPLQRELDERAALEASLSDEIDLERYLDIDEKLSFHRANVGPEVVRRLRRGHWVVQDKIDLHGLRVDQARAALVEFVALSYKRGNRCLRVIHGKGLGSVGREPVLKDKVPKWLVQRQEVLAFCQAPPTDGGGGALFVLLRAGG